MFDRVQDTPSSVIYIIPVFLRWRRHQKERYGDYIFCSGVVMVGKGLLWKKKKKSFRPRTGNKHFFTGGLRSFHFSIITSFITGGNWMNLWHSDRDKGSWEILETSHSLLTYFRWMFLFYFICSENLWFSGILREYKMETFIRTGSIDIVTNQSQLS